MSAGDSEGVGPGAIMLHHSAAGPASHHEPAAPGLRNRTERLGESDADRRAFPLKNPKLGFDCHIQHDLVEGHVLRLRQAFRGALTNGSAADAKHRQGLYTGIAES